MGFAREGSLSAILTVLACGTVGPGCKRPVTDLRPVRADLVAQAAVMCASPPARAPHASRNGNAAVSRDLASAALVRISAVGCQLNLPCATDNAQCAAAVKMATPDLEVLHDALVDDHAVVGDLRKNLMLQGDVPVANLDMFAPSESGIERAKLMLEGEQAKSKTCAPWKLWIERVALASARSAALENVVKAALARCADVAALERDRFVVGTLTDAMLGVAALTLTKDICAPIIDAAPADALSAFRASIEQIRKSCPADLHEILRRDRAGVMMVHFGSAWDPTTAFPCERASKSATLVGEPLDPRELVGRWKEFNAAASDATRYSQEYAKGLADLDDLATRAGR